MKCPKCEQKKQQYRNGKTKAGSQRYRCHNCGYSYTPEKKAQGYSQAFRQRAIKMYIDGAGLRRTGRQLGVHHDIARAEATYRAILVPYVFLEGGAGFNSDLFNYARQLVRASAERARPNADRLRGYTDAQLPQVKQALAADTPVYPELEQVRLFLKAGFSLTSGWRTRTSPSST